MTLLHISGVELQFSSPSDGLALPGFDKSKKANQPSLGLKNFKKASKKGAVSETPIGSPRAMQMAGNVVCVCVCVCVCV